jgi:hypothetical protein
MPLLLFGFLDLQLRNFLLRICALVTYIGVVVGENA